MPSFPSSAPDWETEYLKTDAELLRRSFFEFAKRAWHLIEPGTPFCDSWHIRAICEHLQAVSQGQIKRLVINVPPRTGKSSLVSILWPCWEWTFNPAARWMFASYAEQLAFLMSVRRRDSVLNSKWYRDRWGGVFKLAGSLNLKHLFSNSAEGYMFSTSTGGQVTGYGGSRLVLDDPHDPKGAESEIKRETTTEWLNLTWPSRLDPVPGAAEVVIMQRLHEMDATGVYLARKDADTVHLKIPMEYAGEKNPTILGYSDPRNSPGELLTPLYPRIRVDELKRILGPYGSAGQLQQEPAPQEGGLIKRAWIRHYEEKDNRLNIGDYQIDPWNCLRFCTVDPAITEKDLENQMDPDYTVMASWAIFQSTRGVIALLLDLIRERMEGPEIIAKMKAFHAHWKFSVIGIETIAFQKMLAQYAKREGLPIREIGQKEDCIYKIDKDKSSRVLSATPLMADGRFYVPTYAPWLGDAIRELTLFPNAAHDDVCDAVAYGVALAEKLGRQGGDYGEETKTLPKTRDRGYNVSQEDDRALEGDDGAWQAIRVRGPS